MTLLTLLACFAPVREYAATYEYTWDPDEVFHEVDGNFDGAPLVVEDLLGPDVDHVTEVHESTSVVEVRWFAQGDTVWMSFGSQLYEGVKRGDGYTVSRTYETYDETKYDVESSPDAFIYGDRRTITTELEVTLSGPSLRAVGTQTEELESTYDEPDRWDSRLTSQTWLAGVENDPRRNDCEGEQCEVVEHVAIVFDLVIEGTKLP